MTLIDLEFNLEDVEDGFAPLPTADYPSRLESQELTKSADNEPMLKFVWGIFDGEKTGKKIFDNVLLRIGWKVKQYAKLLNIESGSQLDPELLVGIEAVIKILLRPQKPKEQDKSKLAGRDPDAHVNEIKGITKIG